jgi:hypothetical protein
MLIKCAITYRTVLEMMMVPSGIKYDWQSGRNIDTKGGFVLRMGYANRCASHINVHIILTKKFSSL